MEKTYFDYERLAKSIRIDELQDNRKDDLKKIISSLKISNAKLEVEFLKNLGVESLPKRKSMVAKHFKKAKITFNEFPIDRNIVFSNTEASFYTNSENEAFSY